ncbi:MAG: hypothetical protein ACFE68_07960 [Candidatus Hodarchaeota archaeon]
MYQKQFVRKQKDNLEYYSEEFTPEKIISIVSSAFSKGVLAVAEEIPSLLKYWESFTPTEEIAVLSSRTLDPFEKRFFNNIQISISKGEGNYVWNGLCRAICMLKFLIDLEIKIPEAKKYGEDALYTVDWEEKKKKLNDLLELITETELKIYSKRI